MTSPIWNIVRGIALSCGLGAAALADPIMAYTAVLPPYTLGADRERPGLSHELLVEMANRAGVEIQIEYLPWGRAQEIVKSTPGTLLFTATRNASREAQYGWVALMVEVQEVFVTMGPRIENTTDAADLANVLILANTPRARRLTEAGLSNLREVTDVEQAAKMLNGGRVDAWYTLNQRAAAAFVEAGLDPSQLVLGAPVAQSDNWLASHLEFDPTVAENLANALETMRSDGTYDAILQRYLGKQAS